MFSSLAKTESMQCSISMKYKYVQIKKIVHADLVRLHGDELGEIQILNQKIRKRGLSLSEEKALSFFSSSSLLQWLAEWKKKTLAFPWLHSLLSSVNAWNFLNKFHYLFWVEKIGREREMWKVKMKRKTLKPQFVQVKE